MNNYKIPFILFWHLSLIFIEVTWHLTWNTVQTPLPETAPYPPVSLVRTALPSSWPSHRPLHVASALTAISFLLSFWPPLKSHSSERGLSSPLCLWSCSPPRGITSTHLFPSRHIPKKSACVTPLPWIPHQNASPRTPGASFLSSLPRA